MSNSLPKPNVVPLDENDTRFTVESIRAMLCNPIYTGIMPYSRIISDEEWVAAAARSIREDGVEQFLVNMLYVLRESYGTPPEG